MLPGGGEVLFLGPQEAQIAEYDGLELEECRRQDSGVCTGKCSAEVL